MLIPQQETWPRVGRLAGGRLGLTGKVIPRRELAFLPGAPTFAELVSLPLALACGELAFLPGAPM